MSANASRDLHLIAARLKVAGERDLRLQMTRGLRTAAKPLIDDVKAAALEKLPKRGGLNVQVAGQKVSASVRTGARTSGVRLVTTAPDTEMTDSGFVRHPLPGNNRSKWVTQQIPKAAGWWSDTLRNDAPKVTAELRAVMATISSEIGRGV